MLILSSYRSQLGRKLSYFSVHIFMKINNLTSCRAEVPRLIEIPRTCATPAFTLITVSRGFCPSIFLPLPTPSSSSESSSSAKTQLLAQSLSSTVTSMSTMESGSELVAPPIFGGSTSSQLAFFETLASAAVSEQSSTTAVSSLASESSSSFRTPNKTQTSPPHSFSSPSVPATPAGRTASTLTPFESRLVLVNESPDPRVRSSALVINCGTSLSFRNDLTQASKFVNVIYSFRLQDVGVSAPCSCRGKCKNSCPCELSGDYCGPECGCSGSCRYSSPGSRLTLDVPVWFESFLLQAAIVLIRADLISARATMSPVVVPVAASALTVVTPNFLSRTPKCRSVSL